MVQDDLDELDRAHWAINTTVRCQHRCVYCFEGDRQGKRDVPAEKTKRIIQDAARHVPAVVFMGAEPTLNPALPELVRFASSLGLRSGISTNALRLADPRYLRELLKAGLDIVELSFPYPDAAVYSAITGAKSAGFGRLLTALENIEEANHERRFSSFERQGRERLNVNVNVVVSAFNCERLSEIMAHVSCRFRVTRSLITLKRIIFGPQHQNPEHIQRCRVSLRDLRRVLPSFFVRHDKQALIRARDFPLCALPGWEHRQADLRYWLGNVEVAHNFFQQDEIHDMYPVELERTRHRYSWLCDECTLDAVCLQRGLFNEARGGREDAPVPLERAWPIALTEIAAGSEKLRSHHAPSAAARPPSASTLLLRELRRNLPPDSVLDGTEIRAYPCATDTLALECSTGTARVRLGAPRQDASSFWLAGDLAIAPEDDSPCLPSMVGPLASLLARMQLPVLGWQGQANWWNDDWRQLAHALASAWQRNFELPPAHCRVHRDGDALQGVMLTLPLASADDHACFWLAPSQQGRPVATFSSASIRDEAALQRVRGWLDVLQPWNEQHPEQRCIEVAAQARELLRRTDRRHVAMLQHACMLLIDSRQSGDVLPCFLVPAGETATSGFLCGAFILRPHPRLMARASARLLAEICRAVFLAQRGTLPLSPFLRSAWQTFGPELLWPRTMLEGACIGGGVGRHEIVLRFVCSAGQGLKLKLHPAAARRPRCAANAVLALGYQWLGEGAPDAIAEGIIRAYARRLSPHPASIAASQRARS